MAGQDINFNASLTDGMTPALEAIAQALNALNDTLKVMTDGIVQGFDASTKATDALGQTMSGLSGNVDALNGSVTGLKDGLTGYTAAIETATEYTDLLAGTLDTVVASTDANTAALDANTVSLDASTVSLDALTNSVDVLSGTVDVASASVDTLTASVDANTASLDANTAAMAAGAAATTTNTSATTANAAANTAATNAGRAGQNERMGGYGAILGATMLLGMAGAALKLGVDLFQSGVQGEDGLNRVAAMTGASKQAMDFYTASIEQLAVVSGKTMLDLSNGLYDVVSAGFNGADAMTVLTAAAKAAAAGAVDLHTVTNGLTSIMRAFGLSANQATIATDTLIEGVRLGKAPFADFSRAIGLVGVQASLAHFGIGETTAALSTLTLVWPTVRQAGQNLQALISILGVNFDAMAQRAKKAGITFNEVAYEHIPTLAGRLDYLKKITGDNNAEIVKLLGNAGAEKAAFYLLGTGAEQYSNNLKAMAGASGATNNAFATFQQTVSYAVDQMKASLSVLGYAFEQAIGPMVIVVIKALASAFGGLAGLFKTDGQTMTAVIIVLAGIVGGLLVGAIVALLSVLAEMMGSALAIAAPFIVAGAAIGIFAAFLMHAYQNSQPLREALGALGQALGQLRTALQPLVTSILQPLGGILHNLSGGMDNLFGSTQPVTHTFTTIGSVTERLHGHLVTLHPTITNVTHTFQTVRGALSPVTDLIARAASLIGQFSSYLQHNRDVLNQFVTGLKAVATFATILFVILNPAVKVVMLFAGIWFLAATAMKDAMPYLGIFLSQFGALRPAIAQLVSLIGGQFQGVWNTLTILWKTQLVPLLHQLQVLWAALQPILTVIGVVIGAILIPIFVGLLGVLLAVVSGIVNGFMTGLMGLISLITGVVQIIVGIVTFIVVLVGGFLQILGDLFTGHANRISADFQHIMGNLGGALGTIWQGIINTILGILTIGIGVVLSFIWGFITEFISYFSHLFDTLVGHSIIPDLVNAVLAWIFKFEQIPIQIGIWILQTLVFFARLEMQAIALVIGMEMRIIAAIFEMRDLALGAVLRLVNDAISFWVRLVTTAINLAIGLRGQVIAIILALVAQFLSNIAHLHDQVVAKINDLKNQVGSIFGAIASQAITWGANIIKNLISGIQSMAGNLKNTVQNVAQNISNFLGIRSPAKEGPMSDADRWAPNFMNMFVGGLTQHIPATQKAAAAVGSALKSGLSGTNATQIGAQVAGSTGANGAGGANGANEVHVHLHTDSGIGLGLAMINPTARRQLVQQFAEELGRMGDLQGKGNYGYTGA